MTRKTSAVLLGIGFVLYVAAKIDFFRRYGSVPAGTYVREHSVYWAAIAALGLIIWLIDKAVSQRH